MSNPSHCQKCGAKFSWWWRHRHICDRCNQVLCDNCLNNIVYTSEGVRKLDFSKKELCNDCEAINSSELRNGGLIVIIKAYEKGYEEGYDKGYADGRRRGRMDGMDGYH